MSWLVNLTPASPEAAAWSALQTLKQSVLGGVSRYVRTSGTGFGGVYTQQGDLLTAASVLSGMGAWGVLRGRPIYDPLGTCQPVYREFCWQFSGAGGVRLKYSPRAGFLQGAPSPSQAPSASDEVFILGGGSDGAPTYDTHFPAPGQRLQGYASEEDDQFWFVSYPVGGGAATSLLYLDLPSCSARDSSLALVDQDPAIIYAGVGGNCCLDASLCSENLGPRAMLRYGKVAPGPLWARVPATSSYVKDQSGALQRVFPAGVSTSANWPSPAFPEETPRYVRRAALSGAVLPGESGDATATEDKGYSELLKWGGSLAATPTLLDLVDPVSGQICQNGILAIGHLLLRWGGAGIQV